MSESQTIDRLQVEISTNLSEFLAELNQVDPAIDNTKKKLETLEDTTGGTSDNMEALAGSTSLSKDAFTQYTTAATTTDNTLKKIAKTAGSFTDETDDMTDALKATGKSAKDAVTGTEAFKDGITETLKPIDEMKKGTQKLIGILKFTGVATAASIAFNAIKSYIEDVKNAADEAYQKISNMGTSLSSLSGNLTATDKAVLENVAPYATDEQATVEIQTKVKQTQSGATATEQTQLIDAFTVAAGNMGMKPTDLYSSVYSAMVKAGEDPTPANILTLLDKTISPVWQTTGADIKQILSLIGTNAGDLKNTGLSLDELIKAGGQSYQTTQDYTQFEDIIKGSADAYQAAYDSYLKQAGAGEEDPTTWLMKQSQADQIRLTEGATQAATEASKTIGEEIRRGIETLDLSGALTLTQSKFFGMTDKEIKDYTDIKMGKYTEDGKYNIFELGNQIDKPYYNQLRYTNIAEEQGQISKDQYVADINTAELVKNTAVAKTWVDLPKILTGMNTDATGRQKEGADYWNNANLFITNMFKGTGTTLTQGSLAEAETSGVTATITNLEIPNDMQVAIPVSFIPEKKGDLTETALSEATGGGITLDAKDLSRSADGMEELGKASEEAIAQVQTFTIDAAEPLRVSMEGQGTAIQIAIDKSIISNDLSTTVTQPTFLSEKAIVDQLTKSYLALAAAREAAAGA